VLAYPDSLNTSTAGSPYTVEGIGYDFIPAVLAREAPEVDVWMKTGDEEAFKAVRMLMRQEGLLVGGSSGSALSGGLKWLKSEEGMKIGNCVGANVVVLLADGIRNYMSKGWFLQMTMEAERSELGELISEVILRSKNI
jgi:cystathionine beta-synthase